VNAYLQQVSEKLLTTHRLLTPRGGSAPIEHALTYFHDVRLPHTALLGNLNRLEDPKADFFDQISRVIVGTMCMGAIAVSHMRITANIAARYSLRRVVTDALTGRPTPIISFPTQSTPVMTAIAKAQVLRAFADDIHARFVNPAISTPLRHFIAAIFKITSIPMALAAMETLSDRCGAQGMFEVNQFTVHMVSTMPFFLSWNYGIHVSFRAISEVQPSPKVIYRHLPYVSPPIYHEFPSRS
jgi:acyl-CoA oxidase